MAKDVTVQEIRKLYDLEKERKMIEVRTEIGILDMNPRCEPLSLSDFLRFVGNQVTEYHKRNVERVILYREYGHDGGCEWIVCDVTKVPEATDALLRRLCIEESQKRHQEVTREKRWQKFLELQEEFADRVGRG